MRDIQTLYNFITQYYKNSPDKSERKFLLTVVSNMQISNCTVGKVKQIILNSLGTDAKDIEITAEDIISFLHDENNITKIQEETLNFSLYPVSKSVRQKDFIKVNGRDIYDG